MPKLASVLVVAALAAPLSQQGTPQPGPNGDRCAALAALRLPDVRITDARHVAAVPPGPGAVHAAHCSATGVIGAEIGFSVWLPDDWNGRLLMNGGGGFVGAIPGPGAAVDRGFAVTSTDTGHKNQGIDARWAMHNVERQLNYAYLAVH